MDYMYTIRPCFVTRELGAVVQTFLMILVPFTNYN